jgi:hypothetical protein
VDDKVFHNGDDSGKNPGFPLLPFGAGGGPLAQWEVAFANGVPQSHIRDFSSCMISPLPHAGEKIVKVEIRNSVFLVHSWI